MSKKPTLMAVALAGAVMMTSPFAYASDAEMEALRAEIRAMRQSYEGRINDLESKLATMEAGQAARVAPAAGSNVPATDVRPVADNSFNPSIGVILNGSYTGSTSDQSEMPGFAVGHEGERPDDGLHVDETELNFSANVDNLFTGNATVALHEHDGETEVEIEEAYIQTSGLPAGLGAKAGRMLVPFGYLNEQHAHADDFADRPLPNRAFFDRHYSDDGVSASWVLPTDFYSEIGAGGYRGRGFPASGADGDIGAWSAYARTGGDVGDDVSWRVGLSTLQANGVERMGNDDTVAFNGDSDLYGLDARLVWAPDGNNREQEVILQGEYFLRDEDGTYDDTDAGTGPLAYNDKQSGWYAQGVYKFAPQWRVGARYSQMNAGDVPAFAGTQLDDGGHDPWNTSAMLDWSNSEFSRVRVQYNHEELARNQDDNQVVLQYIMSIGAHGAHPF